MKTKKLPPALLSVVVFLLGISSAVLLPADDRRPNILFIMVDDQSPFDLKVYDKNSKLATPNIDQLAARGMVFDAALQMGAWSGGVCTSSRHMIMAGRPLWHVPNKPG